MTAFALGLLLAAGFVHAGWNYLAKQAVGTVMGARWLSEGDARRRIPAAVAIVCGVAALAIG